MNTKLIPAYLLRTAILLVGAMICDIAVAAKVTRVNPDRGIVQIDAGEEKGFRQGTRVCIFGRNDARITCGGVMRSSRNRATIRVQRNIERVRQGMEVRPADASKGTARSSGKPNKYQRNVRLNYIATIMSPSEFNRIVYDAPEGDGEVESLWAVSDSSGLSLLGFGGEIQFPVGSAFALGVGARYRLFRGLLAEADYDLRDKDLYARMEQSGTSIGFYLDGYFLDLKFSDAFIMRMSGGLDMDMSTVELNAERKSEKENPDEFKLAAVKSSLNVISLRIGTGFNLFLDPFGLHFGLNVLVPLVTSGPSISGSSEDPNGNRLTDNRDVMDDVKKKMAHSSGSVGLEFIAGVFLAF